MSEHGFLEIVGVSKTFGEQRAIESADLAVREGEFFTLLGPSGCGKTTLLRILSGFEQAGTGHVSLRGKRLDRVPPERRPFNMVFQSYALFPHMSVAENVAYGLRMAGRSAAETQNRVADALRMVHLAGSGERRVTELSGGQQQRVALARALVNEPQVLLLDEPLGALDLKLRKHLQNELREIQRRLRTTFVYVTHDQEEALTLWHRIALMNAGRVVQVGTPREVYERPLTRFAADFVGETNLIACEVVESEASSAVVRFAQGAGGVARLGFFASPPLTVGQHAVAALRPEHLEFASEDAAHFTGSVRETVFLGTHCRHDVELRGGDVLRVVGDSGSAPQSGSVGVRVRDGMGVVVHSSEPSAADNGSVPPGAASVIGPADRPRDSVENIP